MKAILKALTAGLLMVLPLATAHAQGPSLSPIANMSMNAGGTLTVNVIATDPQNRVIQLTAALPPFATLNTPTIGTGSVVTSLILVPTAAHVGDYSAAITATAGGISTTRVFQISVNAMGSDRAPVVVAAPIQEVTAGAALSFVVTASDADGDVINSLSASGLPGGATFVPNGSNTSGTFNWTPGEEDAGEFDVEFTAANALSGTSVTHVHVSPAPTLGITPIDDVTVAGGSFVSVPVHVSGVPGAMISLAAALPTFATLNPPGTGTGAVNTTVTVSPPTGSAGTYHASITAISLGGSVTEEFDIIVTGTGGGDNHPPVLSAPLTATVAIGSTLSFDVTATDPDGDHVDLFGSALPPGSSFTDHANMTGTFTWTPVAGQAGTYTASFSGLDNRGGSGSAATQITVTGDSPPKNQAPVLSAPASVMAVEGVHFSFTVSASDADGDPVTLSAGSLPAGATFSDLGNNTGTFSWTPDTTQVGSYGVAFLGSDGNGGSGTANTTITVRDSVVPGPGPGGDSTSVPGRACLVGKLKPNRDQTCFRIKPVDGSFDLRDVVLTSIRFRFEGQTLAALDGAHIQRWCYDRSGHGHDEHGDDDGDDEDGNGRPGAGRNNGGHGDDDDHDQGDHGDHGYDKCGVSCDDHHDHRKGCDPGCDTLGVRACFSTEALMALFDHTHNPTTSASGGCRRPKHPLPCAFLDAEILATLSDGRTVVATFGGNGRHRDDEHDDDLAGNDDDGKLAGLDPPSGPGKRPLAKIMRAQANPNPLNPHTVLSFAMPQDGRVRVGVYDMQGRLVKNLMDDFRTAGQLTVAWNGTNEGGQRVPSGVYFLRIFALEGAVTRRVAVVR